MTDGIPGIRLRDKDPENFKKGTKVEDVPMEQIHYIGESLSRDDPRILCTVDSDDNTHSTDNSNKVKNPAHESSNIKAPEIVKSVNRALRCESQEYIEPIMRKVPIPIFTRPSGLKDALRAASCLSKSGIDGAIKTRYTPKGCKNKKKVRFKSNADTIPIMCVKRDLLSRTNSSNLANRLDKHGIYSTSELSAKAISKAHSSRKVRALIDTGATKSVVGLRTAKRIARAAGESLQLAPSSRRFRFGVDAHSSMGSCHVRILTPTGVMDIQADVVKPDVPFLIGLDALDQHRLQPLLVTDRLQHIPHAGADPTTDREWSIGLVRDNGHLYLPFNPIAQDQSIFYTRSQLEKLHRSLYHPSATQLYELLKRADPDELDEETRKILQEISQACLACQRYSPAPLTFKISIPGESRFNRQLRLDLCWIEDEGTSCPVLHVIDTATHLQAASFLSGEDSGTVWTAFVMCWSRLYVGDPDELLTDSGSCFTSDFFKQACKNHQITLRHTNTESHNSLGEGETYHKTIRKVFLKLRLDSPSVPKEVLLQLSVYAANTSVNAHGLIPMLLVYGMLPKMPAVDGTGAIPQDERMKIIISAREEYARNIAQRRIKLGLKKNAPSATDETFEKGDYVFIWRETPRLWTGPFKILQVEGKNIWAKVDSKAPKPFSINRVKRAIIPSPIMWTEVLKPKDPRSSTPEMTDAVRKEMVGLIRRGTFKLVVLEEPNQENIIPTKFVLALKHATDGTFKHKARFVLGGHRDKEKASMVHTASAMSHSSVRLVLALASALGLELWTEDVKQAYLQSAATMQRDIFVKPKELSLGHNEFLKLVLPLYGLSESGDYWARTLSDHCKSKAKMVETPADPSLFYRRMGSDLCAISGNYVDDLLRAAPAEHRDELRSSLRTQFECGEHTELPSDFLGYELSRSAAGLEATMKAYLQRLKPLAPAADFKAYSSLRASLLWLSHARPDVAAFASLIGSNTEKDFESKNVTEVNKKLISLQENIDICLRFPPLDPNSLRLVCYADASFANRKDKSSQIGHVTCLVDGTGKMCILHFKSGKCYRVVKSAMAAETIAFAAAFDASYTMRRQIELMMGKAIPLLLLTDSKCLFDVLTSNKSTTEGRLMLDIFAARQGYNRREIDNIGLIRSEVNLADDLTKANGNGALTDAMKTNQLSHDVEDYIIRGLEIGDRKS